ARTDRPKSGRLGPPVEPPGGRAGAIGAAAFQPRARRPSGAAPPKRTVQSTGTGHSPGARGRPGDRKANLDPCRPAGPRASQVADRASLERFALGLAGGRSPPRPCPPPQSGIVLDAFARLEPRATLFTRNRAKDVTIVAWYIASDVHLRMDRPE